MTLAGIRIPEQIPAEPRTVELGDLTLAAGLSVEGRVTDRHGRPIEGAEVSIWTSSPGPYLPPREHSTTGADGRFRLSDLLRGSLVGLNVRKDGYAPADVLRVEVPTTEPLRVELTAARVITGRVIGPAGEAVPQAEIDRLQSQEIRTGGAVSSSMRGTSRLGKADGDGRFRLAGLEEETLDLLFKAPGYKSRKLSGVEPGEEGGKPLEVTLELGESVEGQVTDGHGEPLPKVQVTARSDRPWEISGWSSTATDADGRYRLGGLDPGHHTIEAAGRYGESDSAEIDVQPGVNRLDLAFNDTVDVDGRVLDVTGAPVAGASVRLRGQTSRSARDAAAVTSADGSFRLRTVDGDYGATAEARDFAETVYPELVHIAGAPVHGLVFQLQRGAVLTGRLRGFLPVELLALEIHALLLAEPPAGMPHLARTGFVSGDTYRMSGLTPGAWRVMAEGAGGHLVEGRAVIEPGMESATLDLEAPAGLVLSGRLLVDGAPLGGARIAVYGGSKAASWGGEAATAHDGSFRLSGLPTGRFQIVVAGPGGLGLIRELELGEDRDVTIEVSTGGLTGRILTAAGQPVAEAVVRVAGDDPSLGAGYSSSTARSDEQGTFTLPHLAAGSYRITVQKEGFALAETRIVVTPGGTVEMQVVLKEGAGG